MMRWPVASLLLSASTLVVGCLLYAEAEVYTALVDLEPLIRTEVEIAKTLGKYLKLEEKRLDEFRRLRTEYVRLYKAAKDNIETFLSNPLNAYVLLRRLTADWKNIIELVKSTESKALFVNLKKQKLAFPSDEDMTGSANAILRLQEYYKLDTAKLAQGEIEGSAKVSPLSAADCYALGLHAYDEDIDFYSVLWLQEALNKLEETGDKSVNMSAIIVPMAYSTHELGHTLHAAELIQKLLKHDPQHPSARNDLAYFKMQLNMKGLEMEKELILREKVPLPAKFQNPVVDRSGFPGLCRGERHLSPKQESQLYCRYTSNKSKYLLLQPVKEEVVSLQPFIALYHDVISEKDVEIIKNISQPKLSRSTIMNPVTGKLETATFRVSKSAWLNDLEHPRVAYNSRIIGEIVNLDIETTDELQIVNYGMGGHYSPHFDFRKEGDTISSLEKEMGNRIATWMYYLSDVELGGFTAFPLALIGTKPKKGLAVFWYNLYESGIGDKRTLHGACPVLVGSKWVANKWFRSNNQEFRRPCSKDRYEIILQ